MSQRNNYTNFIIWSMLCSLLWLSLPTPAQDRDPIANDPANQSATPTPSPDLVAGSERLDEFGISQVWIPVGTFIAGSTQQQADNAYQTCTDNWSGMCLEHEYAAELFQREVTLTYGYWIDQYEVTNEAYEAFVADGGISNARIGPMMVGTGKASEPALTIMIVLVICLNHKCHVPALHGMKRMLMLGGGVVACQLKPNGNMRHAG